MHGSDKSIRFQVKSVKTRLKTLDSRDFHDFNRSPSPNDKHGHHDSRKSKGSYTSRRKRHSSRDRTRERSSSSSEKHRKRKLEKCSRNGYHTLEHSSYRSSCRDRSRSSKESHKKHKIRREDSSERVKAKSSKTSSAYLSHKYREDYLEESVYKEKRKSAKLDKKLRSTSSQSPDDRECKHKKKRKRSETRSSHSYDSNRSRSCETKLICDSLSQFEKSPTKVNNYVSPKQIKIQSSDTKIFPTAPSLSTTLSKEKFVQRTILPPASLKPKSPTPPPPPGSPPKDKGIPPPPEVDFMDIVPNESTGCEPSNFLPPPDAVYAPSYSGNVSDAREGITEWHKSVTDLYEIIQQIGEGTYGKVYKGRCRKTNSLVALKRVRTEHQKEGFPITAIREIRILRQLNHPNIISLREIISDQQDVCEFFRQEGSFFLVFDYMDHDLMGILESGSVKFSPEDIQTIFIQLMNALHHCHSRNFLHRDIKCSNILLNNQGIVKLADFGLARLYESENEGRPYTNCVITLWYRPPELLLGEERYGPYVDIWSCGCILAELFTGRTLFHENHPLMQLDAISRLCGTPHQDHWPEVKFLPYFNQFRPKKIYKRCLKEELSCRIPPIALDLIDKMLILNPSKRLSAQAVLQHPFLCNHKLENVKPLNLPTWQDFHEMFFKQKRSKESSKPVLEIPKCQNLEIQRNISDSGLFVSEKTAGEQSPLPILNKYETSEDAVFGNSDAFSSDKKRGSSNMYNRTLPSVVQNINQTNVHFMNNPYLNNYHTLQTGNLMNLPVATLPPPPSMLPNYGGIQQSLYTVPQSNHSGRVSVVPPMINNSSLSFNSTGPTDHELSMMKRSATNISFPAPPSSSHPPVNHWNSR